MTKQMNVQHLFSKETGNANNYRIPAILKTKSGVVIAAADERFFTGGDNPNRIDKVVRRSLDNGKTWESQITVVKEQGDSKMTSSASIDPCLLYDEITNTVFMLYSHTPAGIGILNCVKGTGFDKNGNKILTSKKSKFYIKNNVIYTSKDIKTDYTVDDSGFIYKNNTIQGNIYTGASIFNEVKTFFLYIVESHDDGLTWSKPRCLNQDVKSNNYSFIGAGPGIGIQIKNGEYKGRLLFPIYINTSYSPILMLSTKLIYSDDHGKTWQTSTCPITSRKVFGIKINPYFLMPNHCTTESQLIELEDGTIKIFLRNHDEKRVVASAISSDGGITWKNYTMHEDLPQSICQLSVITCNDNGRIATVFLNGADKKIRRNGTIRLSYDYGETFDYSRVIKQDGFVYSSIVEIDKNKIGITFEPSTEHETIDFTTVSLDWIKGIE